MIEGPVAAVITKKAFSDTPDWVVATVTAAPAFCNVTSFIWTKLATGERAVRMLALVQAVVLAMVLLIACIPLNALGLYLFVAACLIARFGMVGVVTLRSTIWSANYARFERARITSKLITIQTLLLAITGSLFGLAMDFHPQAFRLIYPVAMLIGLVGVRSNLRLRVRRPFLMKARQTPTLPVTDYGQPPFAMANSRRLRRYGHYIHTVFHTSSSAAFHIGSTLTEMWRVLRDDVPYRGYMVCMALTGIGNLAINPPMVLLLTEKFQMGYVSSLVLLQSIPLVMIPFWIPMWARLLDRVHVIRFRSIHIWVFVLAHALLFTGAFLHSVPILVCAQIVRGIAFGGGALAWNIGHNDFASRQDAGLYMTIHVTLTGLRALVGAALGIMLYSGFTLWGHTFPALEEFSFIFWGLFTTLGALGFVYLNHKLSSITKARP